MRAGTQQLFVLVGALLSGCAAPALEHSLFDFRVMSRGNNTGDDFCRNFTLTSVQAEWFFARATVVEAIDQHDRFSYLPCWVRGTARDRDGLWQWEVRAGGTARLSGPTGTVLLLACSDCEEVLRGDEDVPTK